MAPEFVSFLHVEFSFIELVIHERICNALMSDRLSNDQKLDSKYTLLSGNYAIVL